MADLTSQIQQARQSGYNDQEIFGYLNQNHAELAPKIQQATKAGYQPKEILDYLSSSSQPATPAPQHNTPKPTLSSELGGLAQKITDFTGLTPIAKGVGVQLGTRPMSDQPTTRQIVGSAMQGVATVGSLGLGGAASLAGRIGESALMGGGIAAGQKAQQTGASNNDILKAGLFGAGSGAAIPAVLEGGSALLKKGASNTAEAIYNSLVKTPANQIAAGQDKIGTGLAQRGISGSFSAMAKQLGTAMENNKQAQAQILHAAADRPVDMSGTISALQGLKAKLAATPGESTNAVDAVLNEIQKNPTLSVTDAHALKQNLQSAVNDAFLRNNTTGVTQAQKVAAQQVRGAIEKAAPEIAPVNRDMAFGIRATKQLLKQANQAPSILDRIRLIEELRGLAGGVAHPALGAGVAAERILTNPRTATPIAKGLYKAGSASLNPAVASAARKLLTLGAGKAAGQ